MLKKLHTARDLWGGVDVSVDHWLKDRQDLIVRYCQLSALQDFEDTSAVYSLFANFCEALVDYVSAGHFEIYEKLVQEALEFDDGGLELAARLYPRIQETTEVALNFNDMIRGNDMTEAELLDAFEASSFLGEALETRFTLEDCLIKHLHKVHGEQFGASILAAG